MTSSPIPITLKGNNLGERHRYLNSLVIEAHKLGRESFESIITVPESSPVDRLFKIDLASRHKHVEYTLTSLQDDDMLYVSRALKCKWLLDEQYCHIINPVYLEDILYPQMITTAVNKMKHWIHLNLKDSGRCQQFYEYYSEKDADYAFKFLCKCNEEILLNEFQKPVMLPKITPHRFKILCEKTPSVAKIFFESLIEEKQLLEQYFRNGRKYFNSLKCILKTDPDTFLNITELNFMTHFKKLSTSSTKFIMTQQKTRFMQKPELYTTQILNVNALAQCLTREECEELIMKLARAQYLKNNQWFNYKNVEPLLKRLDVEKRASIKKKVFVDKDVGELVTDWPYPLPKSLTHLVYENDTIDIFLDYEKPPSDYDYLGGILPEGDFCDMHKCARFSCNAIAKPKTLLDSLFNQYRFTSFDKTLYELRTKLRSESSSQNRMYMMLVLVSKSGGEMGSLDALLKLLIEYRNEPCQVRAAVVRSLVKRAYIWRVTDEIWCNLVIFSHGLGLDGNPPEADCNEGLHAVVIRTLLSKRDCAPAIKAAFIKNFSPLTTYSLTTAEKQLINQELLHILLEGANAEVDVKIKAQILQYVLDTLKAYKIKFDACAEVITSIKNLVNKDHAAAKCILMGLFDSKLGRKEFFKANFELIQNDASYVNALKHDITILSVDKFVNAVISDDLHAEQFLRKISVYFNENEGLTNHFLTVIKQTNTHKRLARPMAYLLSDNLKSYMLEQDTKDLESKRFFALIRANAHVARPTIDLDSLEWSKFGAKLIANQVLKCKAVDIDRFIKQLLTWKRTARLALILAQRTCYEADVYEAVAKMRPTIALKTALTYFRRQGDQSDLRIWKTVKPWFTKVKVKTNRHLLCNLRKVESMPLCIRPEYATETFKVINDVDFNLSLSVLCNIMLLLPNIEEDFIEDILCDFIKNRFILLKNHHSYEKNMIITLYLRIFAKFLLFSKTEEIQNKRFMKIGQLFFDHLRFYWESTEPKLFFEYLNIFIHCFKCSEAFLNKEYVSCLPVMEKFVTQMQSFLPMEKYFTYYAILHLTMLYYKTLRQIANQMPEMLADKQRRCNEGRKVVGDIFGKYVCREAHVLRKSYFDSIIVLYSKGLIDFVNWLYIGRFRMIPYIIKSIIEVSDGFECTLALHLYDDYKNDLKDNEIEEIRKCWEDNNSKYKMLWIFDWQYRHVFSSRS